jgi:hypothetical protein
MRRTKTTNNQDAENGSLRRSHFAQALDVPTKSTPRALACLRPRRETVLSILGDAATVSEPIRRVSPPIQREESIPRGCDWPLLFSDHRLSAISSLASALRYKLFIAECAALIVYSISRVE